jgi:drug/metabolite transporter (DMT)-like permease
MSELRTGELAAVATAVLWTLAVLIWTSAGKRVGALAVSFIRVVMACLLLMAYGQAVRGLWLPTDVAADTWLLLGLAGFLWFFISDLCVFKAFLLIGPRLTLLILSLTPPLAAALSWISIGDQLAGWCWLAMGVTLAGVAWVVSERTNGNDRSHDPRHRRRGVVLAMIAAALQAVAYVMLKEGVKDCDDMAVTQICMLGAVLGYVTLITFWRRWPLMLAALGHHRTMALLVVGAILGPFMGVALNMVALRHAPTGVVVTIIATMPVMILPFSVVLYHEKVSLRAIGGAIVAVVGVAMLVL